MNKKTSDRAKTLQGAIELVEVLDVKAAGELHAAFLARRGENLVLDGSGVRKLGAQCLQIMLAALLAWRADGHRLELRSPSEALLNGFDHFGVAFNNVATEEWVK